MDGWGIKLQSNRPVLCMKFNVSSRICLFTESGKSLLPYNNSCNKIHLEDLHIQVVLSNAKIPARRSRLCTSKQGQSNEKCLHLHIMGLGPFCDWVSKSDWIITEILEVHTSTMTNSEVFQAPTACYRRRTCIKQSSR